MAEELSHELEWAHYAKIEAVGDTKRYLDAVIPEIEKHLEERLWFEKSFLKTEDGKWGIPDVALAPVTAGYLKSLLDRFKSGNIDGAFNIGDRAAIYALVKGYKNKLVADLYVYKSDFDNEAFARTENNFDAEWRSALSRQVAYLNELGFSVKSKLIDKKDMKVLKLKSTEDSLTVINS